jgi:C_GCAxxG_C_C family probable redox protein
VLAAFPEECGITEEQAYRLGQNFGSGMKLGSACGALVGGLMVLGMAGAGDSAARTLSQRFQSAHGCINCPDLLRKGAEAGNFNKKAHCDGLVYEVIQIVQELL